MKQAKTPKYPILEYYIQNPELLSKNIPESWMKNKYVATSLATFIFLGTPKTTVFSNPDNTEIIDTVSPDKSEDVVSECQDSVKIAPIFVHGGGSGAMGCMVMSPPVFISEEEAMAIIFDELKAEGLEFDTVNCPEMKFKSYPIADGCFRNADTANVSKENVEIKMDGYNKDLNLAVQFVSSDDYYKFRSNDRCVSSVLRYKTKSAAEIIRDDLVRNGKANTVVFYDPIASIDFNSHEDWEECQRLAKADAKKLLLAQVEDFIKWIKKEQIIKK